MRGSALGPLALGVLLTLAGALVVPAAPTALRAAENDPDPVAEWVAQIGTACGAAARAERALGGVVALRVGAEGPTVAVLVDGGTPEGSPRGMEEFAARVALGPADLSRSALLFVILPADPAPVPGVRPELNFPWRWDEARRVHGAAAGAFPGEVPWVGGVSDVLLGERGIAAVVDGRPRADGDTTVTPEAGRLAGLTEGRLGARLRVDPTREAALQAFAELPSLELGDALWRRMGAAVWVMDFRLGAPGGATRAAAVPPERAAIDVELGITPLVEGLTLSAFAAAPDGPGVLELVPVAGGRPRLAPLVAGERMRCRAVLTGAPDPAAPVSLRVVATSSGGLSVERTFTAP